MRRPAEGHITLSQTEAVTALVTELRARIAEAADPDRAPAMQAYMKSQMPFRGVSAVPLRRICREVLAAHRLEGRAAWELAVRTLWDDAGYREERYATVALTGHRYYREFQDAVTLSLYRHLVVTGAWWDLVDDVAIHRVGPILRADPATVAPVIQAWARESDMWLRRTAILCQRASKAATDADLLADALCANLEGTTYGREFFIRKAMGWALREYARTDPDWVRSFVDEHHADLSGLTRREALKHL